MQVPIQKRFQQVPFPSYGADMATEIAKRIRAARNYVGLSQPQLAAKLGTGRVRITDLEMGREEPTQNELCLIALHCELPDAFFTADFAALEQSTGSDQLTRIERLLTEALSKPPVSDEQDAMV